jgi:hypothetical protein
MARANTKTQKQIVDDNKITDSEFIEALKILSYKIKVNLNRINDNQEKEIMRNVKQIKLGRV